MADTDTGTKVAMEWAHEGEGDLHILSSPLTS